MTLQQITKKMDRLVITNRKCREHHNITSCYTCGEKTYCNSLLEYEMLLKLKRSFNTVTEAVQND